MRYWLMKAEPNSRIVKGKDVKFSVEDFESVGMTAWEGVRNHEAKKLMQSMKVGDQVLFYHSNCKNPGVTGFAEISKEAYPDHTAWDPDHPYYDPKSDKENPRWFMVDATFKSRTAHFVPLTVFKRIANQPTDEPPKDVSYIGQEGIRAIKEMALIKRGRLSVQPVEEDAWRSVQLLAEKGGWEEALEAPDTTVNNQSAKKRTKKTKDAMEKQEDALKNEEDSKGIARSKRKLKAGTDNDVLGEVDEQNVNNNTTKSKKRKADRYEKEGTYEASSLRRSTRSRR